MAGFSYQIVRGQGSWYDTKDDYFRDQLDKRKGQLCQVMAAVVEGAGLVGSSNTTQPWHGFPWLTPVLGSGCLEIGSNQEVSPSAIHADVASAVKELLGSLVGSNGVSADHELPDLAGAFAEALVRDRISSDENQQAGHPPLDHDREPMDVSRARVVLVAALLNRLYFLAKSVSDSPITRWNSDAVSLDLEPGEDEKVADELMTIKRLCVHHLKDVTRNSKHLLDSLEDDVDQEVAESILGLVRAVRDEILTNDQVLFAHLKLVTEVTWYLISLGTSLYPGWTDLLFKLMLGDEYETTASTTRPAFSTLTGVGDKVADFFHRPTTQSWEDWVAASRRRGDDVGLRASDSGAFSDRQRFYLSIAELLWAESRARTDARPAKLPVASGFAASFDLELEMALLATAPAGASIYVVVPVQVLPERESNHAKLCWLRAEIRRSKGSLEPDLQSLLEPERWDLVHPNLEDGLEQPHVVHLSGCPLLPLPVHGSEHHQVLEQLNASMQDALFPFAPEHLVLEHAVTIDEYLALQQSEAELLWSVGQRTGGGTNREASGMSLALPPLILSSSTEKGSDGGSPRFWMTLGVPVSDPAIRSRIVTQLTLKTLLEKTQQGSAAHSTAGVGSALHDDDEDEEEENLGVVVARPKEAVRGLAGVVVNRRITQEEGGILYWLGLDVVHAIAENFMDDVRHYTLHLAPGREHERVQTTGPCPLAPAGGR